MPFWQSGHPVGIVCDGVGSGDVVGGIADVVMGSDSVAPDSETDGPDEDGETESEGVSSRDWVSSLDGVGVLMETVIDRVVEGDAEIEAVCVADEDGVSDLDTLVVSDSEIVGVGGGVHVGLMDFDSLSDLDSVRERVTVGPGVTLAEPVFVSDTLDVGLPAVKVVLRLPVPPEAVVEELADGDAESVRE